MGLSGVKKCSLEKKFEFSDSYAYFSESCHTVVSVGSQLEEEPPAQFRVIEAELRVQGSVVAVVAVAVVVIVVVVLVFKSKKFIL